MDGWMDRWTEMYQIYLFFHVMVFWVMNHVVM